MANQQLVDTERPLGTVNSNNINKYCPEITETPSFRIRISPIITLYLLSIYSLVVHLFPAKKSKTFFEKNREGYPNLLDAKSEFFYNNYYKFVRYNSSFPVLGVPGTEIEIKKPLSSDYGRTITYETIGKCINLGSYNYLGFAQTDGLCTEEVAQSIVTNGLAFGSTRCEFGTHHIHKELESLTAQFVGVEAAITFGMGFATNSLNIPALFGRDCLALSDEKNHASIVLGLRLSGATIKVFNHNSVTHLEEMLIEALVERAQQTGGNTFKKIVIIIEGIYSMEGSIVNLPDVVRIKKKYNAYIYLDEAHSIGSLGRNGRGVTDHYGIDPKDIDILMGTFTKSFGSVGGYIAGSKKLIDYLRVHGHGPSYAASMSAPVAQQIISSMRIIMGLDGTTNGRDRIHQLARNTRYFRQRLKQIGVILYGNEDSPVVPIMVTSPAKVPMILKQAFEKGIALVLVSYPATEFDGTRIRVCLSAGHTKEQLDYVIKTIDEIADKIDLRYSRKPRDMRPIEY